MPPDPSQLLAQAGAANGQADAKDDAARRLRAEGDAITRRVDFVMAEIRNDVWMGGAARTCRKEAGDRAQQLHTIDDHLHGWADVTHRSADDLRRQASTLQRNADAVAQWQAACQARLRRRVSDRQRRGWPIMRMRWLAVSAT
jgi:hypothetical protein